VYLFRCVAAVQQAMPKANIPTVALPAAEPFCDVRLDDVADPLVQLAYVYLLRVCNAPLQQFRPRANIPTVEFPVAELKVVAALAAVADAFTSPE
jgi:hypothetical protein